MTGRIFGRLCKAAVVGPHPPRVEIAIDGKHPGIVHTRAERPVIGSQVVECLVIHFKHHSPLHWLVVFVKQLESPLLLIAGHKLVAERDYPGLELLAVDRGAESKRLLILLAVVEVDEVESDILVGLIGHLHLEVVHAPAHYKPALPQDALAAGGNVIDVRLGHRDAYEHVSHILAVDIAAGPGQPHRRVGDRGGLVGSTVQDYTSAGSSRSVAYNLDLKLVLPRRHTGEVERGVARLESARGNHTIAGLVVESVDARHVFVVLVG